MKYHIDRNGKPAICRATKRPCPLGGDEVHFDTMEEAQTYADKQNAKEFGLLNSVKQDLTPDEKDKIINNRLSKLKAVNDGVNYAMRCHSCVRIPNIDDSEKKDTHHMKAERAARRAKIIELYGEGELLGTYVVNHRQKYAKHYRKQIVEMYDNGRLEIFDYKDKSRVTIFMAHGTRCEAMALLANEVYDETMYQQMTKNHENEAERIKAASKRKTIERENN